MGKLWWQDREWSAHEVRLISVRARRDPRTVLKVLQGDAHVSELAREAIVSALGELRDAGHVR